jgi:hypothetical protein
LRVEAFRGIKIEITLYNQMLLRVIRKEFHSFFIGLEFAVFAWTAQPGLFSGHRFTV